MMTTKYSETLKNKWERKLREHEWQRRRTRCAIFNMVISAITLILLIWFNTQGR